MATPHDKALLVPQIVQCNKELKQGSRQEVRPSNFSVIPAKERPLSRVASPDREAPDIERCARHLRWIPHILAAEGAARLVG